ncbi:pirin family protein [Brevibacillus choshinensis]|uniref:Pirin family protein n=1 Tax=Brevibacillus choshinensis TaxID=54911 RepID=A0ABX7FJE2_BRECH|nr:pirin family protein [Brevibacillus choshinensis]QRG66334.1 pirin family protein [Brevibacillus choshinensis]
MFQVYPSNSRYSVDAGWLRSHLSFSFGEYFDPNNTSFGVMRVCNDDEVAGGKGFGPHPHSDMEVVTIVLDGQVKHEDNLGNVEVISVGEVQRMSAGTGIVHAEYNGSETEGVKFLQLWFMPQERGLTPSFETKRYDQEQLNNDLLPVVSRQGSECVASIHQDMTIYLSRLEQGRELSFEQEEGRRVFLFVIEGKLAVNGHELGKRDTARIQDVSELAITALDEAFFMLIDLP